MADDKRGASPKESVRLMVEDITVTPFFGRHKGHTPAEIKLHAEVEEEDDHVVLTTSVAGFHDDLIDVSATENTIQVTLHSGRSPKEVSGEARHEDTVALNSSYLTPALIDPAGLTVLRKGDTLVVKAPKVLG